MKKDGEGIMLSPILLCIYHVIINCLMRDNYMINT